MPTSPKTFLFTILSSALLFLLSEVHCSSHHNNKHHNHDDHRQRRNGPSKLFVFGDSYADTGNLGYAEGRAWFEPYGMTFPGVPTGRFSDGRVLTDFVAMFLGIKSPLPYKARSLKYGKQALSHGMNFAFGGTGVFDTTLGGPNMTTQIDMLQEMININAFTIDDLESSVALVCLSGNDYSTHMAQYPNTTSDGWKAFIKQVVTQLVDNTKRIRSLGIKKIAITELEPLGCLPTITANVSYQRCNDDDNSLVKYHNTLFEEAVPELNNETKEPTVFLLDLYNAFLNVLTDKKEQHGSKHFDYPMKPCCEGKTPADNCGYVTANGEKSYTLCQYPANSFFFDSVHPTEEGWRHVFKALKPCLGPLRS